VLSVSLLLDERSVRAVAGFPDILLWLGPGGELPERLSPGGIAPAGGWYDRLRELLLREATARPESGDAPPELEPVEIPLTRGFRERCEHLRIEEVGALGAALAERLGADTLTARLRWIYAALAQVRKGGGAAALPADMEGVADCIRLAWLSLPLTDRLTTPASTEIEAEPPFSEDSLQDWHVAPATGLAQHATPPRLLAWGRANPPERRSGEILSEVMRGEAVHRARLLQQADVQRVSILEEDGLQAMGRFTAWLVQWRRRPSVDLARELFTIEQKFRSPERRRLSKVGGFLGRALTVEYSNDEAWTAAEQALNVVQTLPDATRRDLIRGVVCRLARSRESWTLDVAASVRVGAALGDPPSAPYPELLRLVQDSRERHLLDRVVRDEAMAAKLFEGATRAAFKGVTGMEELLGPLLAGALTPEAAYEVVKESPLHSRAQEEWVADVLRRIDEVQPSPGRPGGVADSLRAELLDGWLVREVEQRGAGPLAQHLAGPAWWRATLTSRSDTTLTGYLGVMKPRLAEIVDLLDAPTLASMTDRRLASFTEHFRSIGEMGAWLSTLLTIPGGVDRLASVLFPPSRSTGGLSEPEMETLKVAFDHLASAEPTPQEILGHCRTLLVELADDMGAPAGSSLAAARGTLVHSGLKLLAGFGAFGDMEAGTVERLASRLEPRDTVKLLEFLIERDQQRVPEKALAGLAFGAVLAAARVGGERARRVSDGAYAAWLQWWVTGTWSALDRLADRDRQSARHLFEDWVAPGSAGRFGLTVHLEAMRRCRLEDERMRGGTVAGESRGSKPRWMLVRTAPEPAGRA
jgi:hypothetical protein